MKLGLVQELEIVKITENGVYLSDPQDSVPVNAPSEIGRASCRERV